MSQRNGDKARFDRQRKKKVHRRERNRKMMEKLAGAGSAAPPAKSKEPSL